MMSFVIGRDWGVPTRREKYAPTIAAVIDENRGATRRVVRRKLRATFPDPPRSHYPYRVWLSEIRYQLGIRRRPCRLPDQQPAPGQLPLFQKEPTP